MKKCIFVLLTAVIAAGSSSTFPCTTFVLRDGDLLFFGRNLDWYTGMGFLITNKRNVAKVALVDSMENPAEWVSKYGSITFNQVGRDLPFGGINEAGLVVEQMSLAETKYPTKDHRSALSECQWIQYQLDNHSTVEEVIASDKLIRIVDSSTKLHFLVCDRLGQAGVIEFLNGKMVHHAGETLPVEALANSIYELSLSHYEVEAISGANRSLYNYVTAARLVDAYELDVDESAVEYSFNILGTVSQGPLTKWSVVYDVSNMKIYFKIFETPMLVGDRKVYLGESDKAKIKIVNMREFDFDCSQVARIIDLECDKEGNINEYFVDYSTEINKEFIFKAFTFLRKMDLFMNITDDDLNYLAEYPESFICTKELQKPKRN
jgi:choloylglycine hydrolase